MRKYMLINGMIRGVDDPESQVVNFSVDNNTSPENITGLVFSPSVYRSVVLAFSIFRKTDDAERSESGTIVFTYNATSETWSKSELSSGEDFAGVNISLDDITGQAKYVSDNLLGANYESSATIKVMKLFEV
jgi:hypothetical protein